MTKQRVYPPGGWPSDDVAAQRLARREVMAAFHAVRAYFAKAAQHDEAMIVYLT